jgi:Aldehyde dehydrogenase family
MKPLPVQLKQDRGEILGCGASGDFADLHASCEEDEVKRKLQERLASLIDPEKIVIGGKSDTERRYIDPTVIYPVTWSDRIMADEIFGPLLPVMVYDDIDEAILGVKKRPKPLSAFLFSKDQEAINHFLHRLSFGGGAINRLYVWTVRLGPTSKYPDTRQYQQILNHGGSNGDLFCAFQFSYDFGSNPSEPIYRSRPASGIGCA